MNAITKHVRLCVLSVATLLAATVSGQTRPVATPFDGPIFAPAEARPHTPVGAGSGLGVQAAVGHILGFQCPDGGFGWPHTVCPTTTLPNLTGPIGSGLLRVWEVTGDEALLDAVVQGAGYDLAAQYPNQTPVFGSFTAAFLHKVSGATNDPVYSEHAAVSFFDALTAGTYGDPTVAGGSFFPGDTYAYLDRHKSLRTGGQINLRPWDLSVLPWVAGEIGNADSTTPPDAATQQAVFLHHGVLSGLDTLNKGLVWDLLGLAGGIYALGLNGSATFPPISAPNFADIDGVTTLCELADVLVSYQNADGSWSWSTLMQDPINVDDKDTQTTAYAILALAAADETGCGLAPGGRYNTEIHKGRSFLAAIQDGTGGYPTSPGGPHNIEAESEAVWAATIEAVSLNATACDASGQVLVTIDMAPMPDNIVGGQFFVDYDETVLTFVGAEHGNIPFVIEIAEVSAPGSLFYAVGVPGSDPGTADGTRLATLTFAIDAEVCTPTADLVTWNRFSAPPTRLTNDLGDEILPTLLDLHEVNFDLTPPVVTPPSAIVVNADAGGCEAAVSVPLLEVSDTCSGIASIVNDYNGTDDATDFYASGRTVVTWTVTDLCGRQTVETQEITVNAVNELDIAVDLLGVFEPAVTRCMTFELYSCPNPMPVAVITQDVTFGVGSFFGTIEVPCGTYTCIRARDALHTLARTDDDGDFGILDTIYVADLSADGTTDQALIGGNLNDDGFIDILDFGILVGQFSSAPGAGTPCPVGGPNADISGDGVVFTEDYTFITFHILEAADAACCTLPVNAPRFGLAQSDAPRPILRITVQELINRGLEDLVVADLNGDGWLDVADMIAFQGGARP